MAQTLKYNITRHCAFESPSEIKWSYFNVYFLTELRDLYLICSNSNITGIPSLLNIYNQADIKSDNGKDWNSRNLLELSNALKKIGLISHNFSPLHGKLFSSLVGEPLSKEDKGVFRRIFYTYDRFNDFHKLFDSFNCITACKKNKSRFYNTFIVGFDEATEYFINERSSEIMRFWDVFLKWGTVLGVYDRCLFKSVALDCNLKGLGISWVYRTREIPENFSILEFATQAIGSNYISILDLTWLIIKKLFFSIDDIKDRILKECYTSNAYSLQSTSAIYIDEEEKKILPRIGTTYMSHLLRLS